MKSTVKAALAAAVSLCAVQAAQADTLKMAFIDPLSGAMASSGEPAYQSFVLAAEHINANGGVNGDMIEILGLDNKISPKESLVQLQKAIDQGARYIMQGNGSSVAAALIDAVNKHNRRNPGEEVVFFNYAAVTPEFTNEVCSFWHFRFDAHTDMKMNGITDWIASRQDIQKVYLIGQDYVHGEAVAHAAETQLAEKRPDIEIVGNELHPLAKVKDFTPYVQKIISSGADAVITGNWGQDMTLLVKAAADAGQEIPYLTFYGGSNGAVAALGEGAIDTMYQVSELAANMDGVSDEQNALVEEYKERFPDYDYYYHRAFLTLDMFDKAAEQAGSNDPIDVAFALEGLSIEGGYGTATMRAEDHQLQQPLYITTVAHDVAYPVDNTDLCWRLVENGVISAEAAATPTTCQMERPD